MSTINKIERPEIFDILDILNGDVDLLGTVISEFMITEEYQSIRLTVNSTVRDTGEKYETEIEIKKQHIQTD